MIQTQVLNYLLNTGDKEFLDKLRQNYFSPEFQNEFKYIREHCDKYGKIPDQYTFLGKFDDFNIISCSESPQYLYDALIEEHKKRVITNHYKTMATELDTSDVPKLMSMITDTLSEISTSSNIKYIDLLDGTGRYEKYLDKCDPNNKSKYFITTGFRELDLALGGWDALEELAVIAARPNVGKSQVAIKCATAGVEQGHNVGIYSGEMSNEKVGYRVDTMLQHIPNYDLTRGDIKSQIMYKKYIDELPKKYQGKLWCLTPLELGHPATVSDLKNFIIDKELDILYVDQYSLLEDQHHALKENEKFANISKDLKNLQVMLKKPIIAVSQQNRGATEEEDIIDLSHIAMSDRIAQDATTVLFLTCKNNLLDMYISKSRDAEKDKKISYEVNWNLGTFNYIPEPEKDSSNSSDDEDDELPFAQNTNSEYEDDTTYEYNAF